MKRQIKHGGFCHHDYANHNVLIDDKGEVNIIDFDYCMMDTYLHDLSSLIIRVLKNGKWKLDSANFIINVYSSINNVKEEDIPIMAGFMEFPQNYWQIGIQYYWEKQPWGEDFFIKKLCRMLKDGQGRLEFIREFRNENIVDVRSGDLCRIKDHIHKKQKEFRIMTRDTMKIRQRA